MTQLIIELKQAQDEQGMIKPDRDPQKKIRKKRSEKRDQFQGPAESSRLIALKACAKKSPNIALRERHRTTAMAEEQTRVLFVDDERMLRDMWFRLLGNAGFDVTVAGTVREALALIAQEKFDVLLADLNIGQPGDGFTIVSAMRRTHPHAVTLILTGYPAFQTALRSIHEQVDDFLVKPTDPKTVIALIRQNLARQRKPEPVFAERLHQIIRKNKESIIDDWYAAVESHPEIARIPLTRDQRVDDLPQVLDELVRDTPPNALIADKMHSASVRHGAVRRKQGYTTPLLLEETRILHRVISDYMQKNLLSIDISNLIPDLLEMHDRIHKMLRVSVEAFLQDNVQQAA